MLLMDSETETVLTLTNFPRLGCPDFCWPPAQPSPHGNVSQSMFFPDECINPHPRFPNLTRNIRQRRGKKVKFLFPLFACAKVACALSYKLFLNLVILSLVEIVFAWHAVI